MLDPVVVALVIALASRQPIGSLTAPTPRSPAGSAVAPRSVARKAQRPKNRKG